MSFETAVLSALSRIDPVPVATATFRAAILFGEGEREARYEFVAPADILEAPPIQLVEKLFATVAADRTAGSGRLEINFAIAHQGCGCITASGRMSRQGGGPTAFILMITRERSDER